jgi:diguanylate cyclase (GGDEF)-like protein
VFIAKFAAKITTLCKHCWYYPQQLINDFPAASKYKLARIAPVVLTSLVVTGAVIGVRQQGGFQSSELQWFDRFLHWHSSATTDPRLLVIEITETDIRNQKQLPLRDITIAKVLAKLQKHQPKVIGLDLYRDIAHAPGTKELAEQLKADNIIVITKLGTNDAVPPPPNIPENRVGFNDFVLDSDNVLRRNLAYAQFDDRELHSFALRISLHYLADSNLKLEVRSNSLQIGEANFPCLVSNSGGYRMEESETLGWQFLLNYNKNITQKLTLTDILEDRFDPEAIKNKIILIGTTAPSQKDLFTTPLSNLDSQQPLMPGVMVHAQMVGQILQTTLDRQSLIWYLSEWKEIVWIWVWSVGGIVIFRRHANLPIAGIILLLAASGLFALSWVLFDRSLWIPLMPSLFSLLAGSAVGLVQKVIYLGFHDPLTGLKNRRALIARLKWIEGKKNYNCEYSAAILCLNIDRFKIINESLGHDAGDKLLEIAARRLIEGLHGEGKLARIGGDEFAIAIVAPNDIVTTTQLAEKLQKSLLQPFNLKGQDTFTNASIGIAFQEKERPLLVEELLRDAQTAMYKAKASGKLRPEVFVPEMHTQAVARLRLETDLRKALKNQEFVLYYQPIICLETVSLCGFEALVRWQSPDRGFVSPGDFIPLAEETGLIVPLGEWVLERACSQMHSWHELLGDDRLMLSVNLSGRQFSQPNLVEKITEILVETKLHRPSLKLEITESMVMDDVESAIVILNLLKTLKLQLSIDDFGTGFSSFNYLHRFPTDTLKVDKSFVSQMDESDKNIEIISTIIMLGHKLNMDVVAEGIETESQMQKLRELGCEYGQGYFFAKALSIEDATQLLLERRDFKPN